MDFQLLGPLEVSDHGRSVAVGGGKRRSLLALLLLHANEVVSAERLIDELWGERPPATSGKIVQVYISQLRRELGVGALLTRAGGYVLRLEPDDLDVTRFERTLAEAERSRAAGEPARVAELLREGLALWRGPPLAEFRYERFAQQEIARLEELRLVALEARIDADLALGRHPHLVSELGALVLEHPLRERMRGQLMLALYRCGRQAEALSTYRAGARMLSDGLGLDPGPALRELERKVVEHSPELAPPASAAKPTEPSLAPAAADERRLLAFGRRYRVAMLAAGLALAAIVAILVAFRGSGSTPRVHGDALALVDARTGELTGSVALGSRPGAVDAEGRTVWVTLPDRGAVVQIDAQDATLRDTVPVGADPSGIAVGAGAVWVANSGSSTVSRISPDRNAVVQTIDVPGSPAAIVFGPGGLWLANSVDDSVSRIDAASGKVVATIGVGDQPAGLALDRRALWVANAASGTVARVDPAAGRVVQSIDVGNGPRGIAAGPSGVWVANRLDGTVSRIDPDTNAVAETIQVGRAPSGVALVGDSVWVSDESEGSVTRIGPGSRALTTFPLGSEAGTVALGDHALLVSVRGAESAHRGGTLTAVAPDVLDSIDPAVAYFSVSWSILALTNDGLVGFKRVGGLDGATLVPDLARSIPRPTDRGRTYTFALRPGIRYSDGSRLRPQDFRRAIERVFSLESSGRPYYAAIVGTEACRAGSCDLSRGIVADEAARTVTYRLSRPEPEFLFRLALPFAFAVPPGTPDREARTRPVPATGPYAIERYARSRELLLGRNPRFREWSRAAQPAGFPDRIAWRFGADERRDVTDVLNGRADLMFFPPPHDRLAELQAGRAGQLHITPRPGNYYMALGTATHPFDDVRARRALNLAVDRRTIGRLFGTTGRSTCQILPPNFPGYVPYCPYDGPDVAQARKLVSESGTAGERVTVWATADYAFGMPVPVGRYFVGLLRSLGYRARLREVKGQENYFAALLDPTKRVQIAFAGWATDYPAESGFIIPTLSCTADTSPLFCDRRMDRRMAAATRLTLTDPVAAHRRWSSVEHALVDRAPWVPLVSRLWVNLVSERVGDFQVHPQVGPLIDQMWVR
jgi:YVTN family beta-propeller protein